MIHISKSISKFNIKGKAIVRIWGHEDNLVCIVVYRCNEKKSLFKYLLQYYMCIFESKLCGSFVKDILAVLTLR